MRSGIIAHLVCFFTAVFLCTSQQAMGQEATPPPAPVSKTASVERVEVIGTRIKRLNVEGPSAVKTFKKEALEESANVTVSDTLRDSNLSTFGTGRETAGSGAAATSNIGLRGLGADRTLILLNGHRLPKDPLTEAVDLNLIPQSAIERIEVLKDGASALYGSDALGGVINLVTKKGYVGSEVSVKHTTSEKQGGAATEVSLVSGSNTENSNLLTILNYSHTDKIFGKDRVESSGGLSPNGVVPAYRDNNGTWIIQGTCPPELIRPDVSGNGSRCYFNFNALASVRPSINQSSFITDYDYRINSNLKFYNRNIVVFKDIEWNYAPYPAIFDVASGTASVPNARRISVRFGNAGNRNNQDTERNYSTLMGVKGNFTDTWEYDASAGYNVIDRQTLGVSGYFDDVALQDLVASGTYDPLNVNNPGDFSSAILQPLSIQKTHLFTADFVVNGEVAQLEDGPVSIATGASFFNDRSNFSTDIKTIIISGTPVEQAVEQYARDVASVFTEFSIPLRKDLEINFAARADKYSDFGSTVNPKIAAKYTVNQALLLRGSVGTGFKAPTLNQLYSAQFDSISSFIDRFACAKANNSGPACAVNEYDIRTGGNRDLKEEKAITGGLGFVYEPNPNYNLSLDLWYTKIKNVVGVSFEGITEAEARGIDPSKYGVTVQRVGNAIQKITAYNSNLQANEVSGLDLNTELTLVQNLAGYKLTANEDLSYLVFYKQESFPGLGYEDILGQFGLPKWRNSFSLNLKNSKYNYSLTLRSIPEQNVSDKNVDEKINPLNELDFGFAYKVSKSSSLVFGVKNIFDTAQPADPQGGSGGVPLIDDTQYDINGRKLFAGFNQKF